MTAPNRPARRSRRNPWLPHQHGAWFMLTVPYVIGLAHRIRAGEGLPAVVWLLLPFWIAGYLTLQTGTAWLKAAPARRHTFSTPPLFYLTLTVALGVAVLATGGWAALGWVPIFLPLLLVAGWTAWHRRERGLASGLATVAAACLMLAVTRFPDPWSLRVGDPAHRCVLLQTAGVFGYFGGTVLYVKTMIRERGSRGWLAASLGWHLAATLLAAVAALTCPQLWPWIVFFMFTVVRSVSMPRLARDRPLRALTIGLVEAGFSAVLLMLAMVT